MNRYLSRALRSASCLALAASIPLAFTTGAMAQASDEPAQEATAQAEQTGIPEWGIESPDFAPDTDIVFGMLDNGMRYAIQKNATPPGEAAIRFNVEVGSREETAAQNGAAHFVEHMAFNGSTDIPEGELLPILERLGLAFGADTNAETALDHTTYKLNLPNVDEETVDTALMVIREMAGELTFDPDAVERERGIIMSEAQVRNSPQRRRAADYFGAALPGSRIGDRISADVERIQNISADDLHAFYDAYYRPDRATLVVVGDFDVAEMQRKIIAEFSDWQGKGEPGELYDSPIPDDSVMTVSSFSDPAIPELIELQRITDWSADDNTAASAREDLLRAIAAVALSNRINALSRTADSPTLGGQGADQALFRSAKSFGLLAVAKDGRWRDTLALAEQELRRAQKYGFSAAEIAEAKANIETSLTNAVAQANGRTDAGLADALVATSLNGSVATSPQANLAFYRSIEPTITAQSVSEAFKEAWQGGPTFVHVSTKQPIEGGDATITEVFDASANVAVTAPEEAAAVEFAYSDWGEPGKVVSDKMIEDLGIREVRFANGLELNLKQTDFEPGKVAFAMRVGSGVSAFPQDKPGINQLLSTAIGVDGFKAHTPDELRRVLAGEQVSIGLSGSSGALVSSGVTTADDLTLQLDLLAARLTATAWRAETEAQLQGIVPVVIKNIESAPTQVFGAALNAVLSGGDARLGLMDAEDLAGVTLDDIRAVVAPQLAEGPLAIGLVGDFDPDTAIKAVAATLGTLPARAVRDDATIATDTVSFVERAAPVVLTHEGEADQGAISLSWQTDDDHDLRDDITRDLLAAVMGLRLTDTLREELGATYSPQAFSFSQETYEGYGHLTAFATVPPEAMDDTARVIREIAAGLAAKPVDTDLIDRARNPIREGYERAESQNGGWLGLVASAQSDPAELDRRRERLAILNSLTAQDVQAAARKYLAGSAPVELRVVPEADAADEG